MSSTFALVCIGASFCVALIYLNYKLDKACQAIYELFHWVNLFEALFEKRYDCEITRAETGKFVVTFETDEGYGQWASRSATKAREGNGK